MQKYFLNRKGGGLLNPQSREVYKRLFQEGFTEYKVRSGDLELEYVHPADGNKYEFTVPPGYPFHKPNKIRITNSSETITVNATLICRHMFGYSPTISLKPVQGQRFGKRSHVFEKVEFFDSVGEAYTDLETKLSTLPNLYISLGGFYVDRVNEKLLPDKDLVCKDYVKQSCVIVFDPALEIEPASACVGITNCEEVEERKPNHFYFSREPIKIMNRGECGKICQCKEEVDRTQEFEMTENFCETIFEPLKEIIKKQLNSDHGVVIDSCLLNSRETGRIDGLNLSHLCYLKQMYEDFKAEGVKLDKFTLLFGSALFVKPITFAEFYDSETPCLKSLTFKNPTSVSGGHSSHWLNTIKDSLANL